MTAVIWLGASVSLVGCFMPWGHTGIIPLVNYVSASWAGVPYFDIAAYALIACVFALSLELIFFLTPRTFIAMLVLFGSLAILLLSVVWIAFPSLRIVEPRLGLDWPHNTYSILYGAYVTLGGGILASVACIAQLFGTLRRHVRVETDLPESRNHSYDSQQC